MLKIKNKIFRFYSKIVGSIAFYPAIITFAFSAFAIIMLKVENHGISKYVGENVQHIVVNNKDTARTILSTIIGGIMSLTVFSFSMVMLLLNQASSNFSPRVLPSLVSNKKHQSVLGIFLGTIVFCLLVSINILPDHRSYSVPGVTTFIGVVLGLFCLAVFVYFLHSISKSIQIGYVLEKLYTETLSEVESKIVEDEECGQRRKELPDSKNWQTIYSSQTGYLQEIMEQHLTSLAKKHKTSILIEAIKGTFIIKNEVIGYIKKELDEDAKMDINTCLLFSSEERIEQNFVLGFKQISEVVVKAMSPGINDPGTALVGIDYLSELFRNRMKLPDNIEIASEEKNGKVYISTTSFEEIFYLNIVSIRQYGRHDVVVLIRLLDLFKSLLNVRNIEKSHQIFLQKQLQSLLEDIEEHIINKEDKSRLFAIGKPLLMGREKK